MYIALVPLCHRPTGKSIKPGEPIDLSRMKPKRIAELIRNGYVAEAEAKDKVETEAQSMDESEVEGDVSPSG